MDPNYDESILVLWEGENGERPKEPNDGKFDLESMKILKLDIYFCKENNKYSKTLAINFHLTGKKEFSGNIRLCCT